MKIKYKPLIAAAFIMITMLFTINDAKADVNVSFGGTIGGALAGLEQGLVDQVSDVWDQGSKLTADSYAISMFSTGLTGQAKLSAFTIGVMFSPTFATEASAIDSGMKEGMAAAKGGAMNAALLFGFSLGSSVDLLFHGTYIPEASWLKGKDKFGGWNAGVKVRFKILGSLKAAGTGLDGLTLGIGAGYGYLKLNYSQDLNAKTTYTYAGYDGTLEFNTFEGEAKIKSFYLSVDLKIYFKILSFLSIYGGAGLIWSNATIDMSADGFATNNIASTNETGSVNITADSKSNHFIPEVMAGIAFNIAFIKIPIQLSMTWSPNNSTTPIFNLTGGITFSF